MKTPQIWKTPQILQIEPFEDFHSKYSAVQSHKNRILLSACIRVKEGHLRCADDVQLSKRFNEMAFYSTKPFIKKSKP